MGASWVDYEEEIEDTISDLLDEDNNELIKKILFSDDSKTISDAGLISGNTCFPMATVLIASDGIRTDLAVNAYINSSPVFVVTIYLDRDGTGNGDIRTTKTLLKPIYDQVFAALLDNGFTPLKQSEELSSILISLTIINSIYCASATITITKGE